MAENIYTVLVEKFKSLKLHRPMRVDRYEDGTVLDYDVNAIDGDNNGNVKLEIEKFVGGGFAGQVYRVKILNIDSDTELSGLQVDGIYAMKILIPPSGMSLFFRNFLCWIGFQGPFQLQVNPTAAKAGAIWQKFIRKAAAKRFGDEKAVNDIHAIFVDSTLGSCGEISDWVDGRTWLMEVDENIDQLRKWRMGKKHEASLLGSDEYRAKYKFMTDFVKLLHEMGAHEFARQYEWTTCKSQPNALKRRDSIAPEKGLTAVDFRAGLALLPFLPMSPGDFKLIWQGLKRGSLVQFDRGDIAKLESFVQDNSDAFGDSSALLEQLKHCEDIYRNSLPDITHNGFKLFYSGKLWKQIFSSAITSWKVRNFLDDDSEKHLRQSKFLTFIYFMMGIFPILGRVFKKAVGREDWRKHYGALLEHSYFIKALKGRIFEKLIVWQRAGRISESKAQKLSDAPMDYFLHLPFSILPISLHRFFTDWKYAKDSLHFIFVRPFKLYFSKSLREQWLCDMVVQGKAKHILSDDDADTILSQLKEPYIQKYLVSLVVHLLTLPITQIVSVAVAIWFYYSHPEMSQEARGAAVVVILGIFQITPISPGSLARGLYTLCLSIKERDFKNYNIAIFLSFFKYIGYLAFPIQMTYHYPALARFMAGHWATEAVHIVPVFGERGALLEHWVFCLFYNWPLTIRKTMAIRSEKRKTLKPRYWQIVPLVILASAIFAGIDYFAYQN